MSVAEAGMAWLKAVLMAPFVAIMFGVFGKIIHLIFQAAKISGSGEYAQTQESVRDNTYLALDLLQAASTLEFWILTIAVIAAIYAAVTSGR